MFHEKITDGKHIELEQIKLERTWDPGWQHPMMVKDATIYTRVDLYYVLQTNSSHAQGQPTNSSMTVQPYVPMYIMQQQPNVVFLKQTSLA